MLIDCDSCAVRDLRCGDCVVSVLLGPGGAHGSAEPAVFEVDDAERTALAALADSGLVPRLQLVPLGVPRLRDGAGEPTEPHGRAV